MTWEFNLEITLLLISWMMLAIVNLIVYLIINSSVSELSLRFFILIYFDITGHLSSRFCCIDVSNLGIKFNDSKQEI